MTSTLLFLLQALVMIALPFTVWRVLRLAKLVPLAVVQILIGIGLGLSLFGRVAPELYAKTFGASLTSISGLASVAVLLFGFVAGLHLQPGKLRGRGLAVVATAGAALATPMFAGFLAGLWIAARYPAEVLANVAPAEFAVAIAICTSVTALPVLAAILRELDLLGRRIGDLSLCIATLSDTVLWIVLGVLISAAASHREEGHAILRSLGLFPAYLAVMIWVVRPWLYRLRNAVLHEGTISEGGLVLVCGIAIGSGAITEALGVHFILGALVAGALIPVELRKPILDRLEVVTVTILMPFFFIATGLRTMIDFSSPSFLAIFLITTAVAMLGKISGTTLVARMTGEPWSTAIGLGALMQTKGLTEIAVLTIFLDGGIISTNVFSAMILMAIVTTALATPLVRLALSASDAVPDNDAIAHPSASPAMRTQFSDTRGQLLRLGERISGSASRDARAREPVQPDA